MATPPLRGAGMKMVMSLSSVRFANAYRKPVGSGRLQARLSPFSTDAAACAGVSTCSANVLVQSKASLPSGISLMA